MNIVQREQGGRFPGKMIETKRRINNAILWLLPFLCCALRAEVVFSQISPIPQMRGRVAQEWPYRGIRSGTPRASQQDPRPAFEQAVGQFQDYIASKRQGIKNDGNLPFILTHGRRTEHAVLMVHGLTDSPYYVKALADIFYEEGFNVLGILLAGHGTRPEDLLEVNLQEWRNDVEWGLRIAEHMGEQVSLAGFSTGGALVLDAVARNHARRHRRNLYRRFPRHFESRPRDFAKLMLFSPAIEIKSGAVKWVCQVPWIVTLFKKYLEDDPEDIRKDKPYNYNKMAINAVCQLYYLTRANARHGEAIRAEIDKNGIVVFAVQSEADQIVRADAVIEFMEELPEPLRHTVVLYPKELGIPHSYVTRPERNPEFEDLRAKLKEFISKDRAGGLEQSYEEGYQLFQ